MTKAYSRNEEDFYEDLSDVLDALESDGYLEIGTPLWEGEIKRPTAASLCFGVVDQVIDRVQENAFEEADEFAGDWPNLPKEKLAELGDLIANWLETNAPPHFFTVQNVKEIEVTAEMLEDHKGVPAAGVPVVDGETISPADADAPTAREAELIALLRKAREGLSCGLWDYGAGQDEHEQCDALIAEIDATLKEPNDGR